MNRWIAVLVVVLGVAAAAGAGLHFATVIGAQVSSSSQLQRVREQLEATKRESGRYPPSLAWNDVWHRPLLYRSNGKRFLLVSFGRDGVPDQGYDLETPPAEAPSCFSQDRDTVFTERGPIVFCLK